MKTTADHGASGVPATTEAEKTKRTAPGGRRRRVGSILATPPQVPAKWVWHYRALLRIRDRLLQDEVLRRHDLAEALEPHGQHLADSATDEFEHDVAFTLLRRDEQALIQVNDALQRILDGRYGVCEATGERIPSLRLRVIPWCRYTREAEERLERRGAILPERMPQIASLQRGGSAFAAEEESGGDEERGDEPPRPDPSRVVDERSVPHLAEPEEGAPETATDGDRVTERTER